MRNPLTLILLLLSPVRLFTVSVEARVQDAAKNIQPSSIAAAGSNQLGRALNNEDIARMLDAQIAPAIIVKKIAASTCDFDTTPSALQKLKAEGVPDSVILAMVLAEPGRPERSPAHPASPAAGGSSSSVQIAAGTPIDIESAFDVSSQLVRVGDRISFRVVYPVIVAGRMVIAPGATATARVTKAERGGHFGRAGRLAWSMEEVVAVDGTRVPLQMSGRLVGDSKGAQVATQTVLTGVLLWPIAPVALLHGMKRGENAFLPAGKRFAATVFGAAWVNVPEPSAKVPEASVSVPDVR